ncbi:hypothetical protein V5P93_003707 [Actinokineospora auranticolor]|uniref:Uncharacterized protein n=1 Tax=Actinokineospora auranticolor TaxID=155976 RepID=A0A2S6GJ77_9PSEU|nr:hypothetical protein [Actinokineospora auranticolor]PPK65269.1 hypothetical protein CLV40_115116 [Actinokineospora auranticolor]
MSPDTPTINLIRWQGGPTTERTTTRHHLDTALRRTGTFRNELLAGTLGLPFDYFTARAEHATWPQDPFHTDPGTFTIRTGTTPHDPDTLTVTLGDLMHRWTNGRWHALRHHPHPPDDEPLTVTFRFETDPARPLPTPASRGRATTRRTTPTTLDAALCGGER